MLAFVLGGGTPLRPINVLIFVTASRCFARLSTEVPMNSTWQPRTTSITTPYLPAHTRADGSLMNRPSHYINHLENTRAMEGHRTLMVHEWLTVASTLGWFHWWQRWVDLGDRDKPDWDKVPVVPDGDFRYKYSSTLVLLGNPWHPAYAHPKLLGQCYDNVYHQGRLIGDLPARGKLPTNEQTTKIYNQEYEEVVARIENTLNLSDESPSYPMVPTSLLNPDIVLPTRLYRAQHGFGEPYAQTLGIQPWWCPTSGGLILDPTGSADTTGWHQ